MWSVWVETRRHAHLCDFLPRFKLFGPQQFMAKVLTDFRKAAKVAFLNIFQLASELCKFAVSIEMVQFQCWYIKIKWGVRRPT